MIYKETIGPTKVSDLRDLGDFCILWPNIRDSLSEDVLANQKLDKEQVEIILWLCRLADKTAGRMLDENEQRP